MENSVNNSSDKNKKFKTFIVAFLSFIIFFVLGLIFYDKFINNEKPPVSTDDVIIDKIATLKRMEITNEDQVVNLGEKEYKIRKEINVDGAFLLINNAVVDVGGETTAYADYAYVTNKFIIFTMSSQDGEIMTYIMDKDGYEMRYNDNFYQWKDLKIVNGNLEAFGHIASEFDGDDSDKELIFKYENNVIIVDAKG